MNSKLFEKTSNLIVEGINSGGNLSSLLDNIVEDMREMQLLKREIKAGVTMYTLILTLAMCIGAPALFGVALYEIETLQSFIKIVPSDGQSMVGFGISGEPLNLDLLRIIVIMALGVNNIFGALMIGLLQSGKAKEGIKTIPILLIISLSIFFAANYLVKSLFPVF